MEYYLAYLLSMTTVIVLYCTITKTVIYGEHKIEFIPALIGIMLVLTIWPILLPFNLGWFERKNIGMRA